MQAGEKTRRCALFVHGVGEQRKSETLLSIGAPLVEWVMAWSAAFKTPAEVSHVSLSFSPFDAGDSDMAAYAVVDVGDQQWYLGEAWWAGSNFRPSFGTMLQWSWTHLLDILDQMRKATWERANSFLHPKPHSSAPNALWRAVDLVNCLAVWVLYAISCLLGYPLLLVLIVLARIPIDAVQDFILLKVLHPLLTANAGEFKLYLDDEVQAANIRRRVADAARQVMDRAGADDLTIVAHSEGAVVSLGMLTDPTFEPVARRVGKLITLGAGLNKSWLVKPHLARLFRPLSAHIKWIDVWATYDPVPAGPLDPRPHSMSDVYGGVVQSLQVTNGMNILSDHGGYFENGEQVLVRVASEIAAPDYRHSVFWPGEQPSPENPDGDGFLHRWVRQRRERVSALALWRDVFVGSWLIAAVAPWWPLNWMNGIDPWGPVAQIPVTAGPAGWIVALLELVRDRLPGAMGLLAPLATMAGLALQAPAMLGVAAIVGLVCWVIYRLGIWGWWARWDARERAAFVRSAADQSKRVLMTTPLGALAR